MDEKNIELAIKQAKKAYKKNEVPIGCVITINNKIISTGYNMVEHKKTSLAHSEIIAIKKAQKKIKNWRLNAATIYITLQPCLMCLNAIVQSRIKKIVYSARSNYLSDYEQEVVVSICKKNNIELISGIKEKESLELIQNFFKEKRKTK